MPQSFRTIIQPARPAFTISHADTVMTIGSCFSEHIGRYFERYKFAIDINPFGQQYNPYSIANALRRLLAATPYTQSDLGYHNELHYSYDHHGNFSRAANEDTLELINSRLQQSSEFLRKSTLLFLTFGTSHFFRLKTDGRVVSNCHKVPASHFDLEMMQPDDIVREMGEVLTAIKRSNPTIKIVLTVSPVRYSAFGHFQNSVSKGNLFSAIHRVCAADPDVYYFPAYELVMDDLRDYRFFADDMLHPNHQAIAYVWEALSQTILSSQTLTSLKDIDEIVAAVNHRPRNPKSEGHIKFVDALMARMEKMEKDWGFDFGAEKKEIQTQSTLSNGGG